MVKALGASDRFSVEAIFPNWHNEEWVSYTLKSVMEGLSSDRITIGATVMAQAPHVRQAYVHPVMHRYALRIFGRHIRRPMNLVYRASRSRLNSGDVAYFWLGSPAELCEQFRERDIMVAREMINCTLQLRRQELRKAYDALDLPDNSKITDDDIESERRDLLATDVIFCPNAHVKASVIAYGFPPDRCIETSYGWSEKRQAGDSKVVADDGTFTAAFVGTVDVRKGAPLLLEAWARAKVKGRLLLAGAISMEVQAKYGNVLNRPDVICLGHVKDVGAIYRAADVFCFPTWEEGGPMVTLEAMSAGCVPIVTSMGSSGAFSGEEEIGIIVPAGDVGAISAALQEMAQNLSLRRHFSNRARTRSELFTWALVGQRRRASLINQRNAWLDKIGKFASK